jgi:hypothetical protein
MKTIHMLRLFLFITILSLFTLYTSAAPTSFAEVEESWQRGLSEVKIFLLGFYFIDQFLTRRTERDPQRINPTPYAIISPSSTSTPSPSPLSSSLHT